MRMEKDMVTTERMNIKYDKEIDKEKYYNKFGFIIDGIVMFSKDWQDDF